MYCYLMKFKLKLPTFSFLYIIPPDGLELEERDRVYNLQIFYLDLLVSCLRSNHPTQPRLLSRVIDCMLKLKVIDKEPCHPRGIPQETMDKIIWSMVTEGEDRRASQMGDVS